MTLELLHVIRDNNIHLQGHQYQIMHVILKTWSISHDIWLYVLSLTQSENDSGITVSSEWILLVDDDLCR